MIRLECLKAVIRVFLSNPGLLLQHCYASQQCKRDVPTTYIFLGPALPFLSDGSSFFRLLTRLRFGKADCFERAKIDKIGVLPHCWAPY